MENIEKTDVVKSEVRKVEGGIVTILKTEIGVSVKGSIDFEGKTLVANYVYNKNSYNVIYTLIDPEGNVIEHYMEKEGILPALFKSPENEVYVSVSPYHPDKEMEISIPLFDRGSVEMPKPGRPYVGKYIGTVNQSAIFHDIDIWSDKKPDKILNIEFKNGQIKKKHNIKVDFPKNNKMFLKDNEIHLIAVENDFFIHRQIDETGKVIISRSIDRQGFYIRVVLNLSFEDSSYLISNSEGKIILIEINKNGDISTKELIDIKYEIFSMWKPVEVAENTLIIRFTTEFGNGWFTMKHDKLVNFFYGKDVQGYKNLLTGETVELPYNNLVITEINKTIDGSYAVIMYPMTDCGTKNKEVIVLNKTV